MRLAHSEPRRAAWNRSHDDLLQRDGTSIYLEGQSREARPGVPSSSLMAENFVGGNGRREYKVMMNDSLYGIEQNSAQNNRIT